MSSGISSSADVGPLFARVHPDGDLTHWYAALEGRCAPAFVVVPLVAQAFHEMSSVFLDAASRSFALPSAIHANCLSTATFLVYDAFASLWHHSRSLVSSSLESLHLRALIIAVRTLVVITVFATVVCFTESVEFSLAIRSNSLQDILPNVLPACGAAVAPMAGCQTNCASSSLLTLPSEKALRTLSSFLAPSYHCINESWVPSAIA